MAEEGGGAAGYAALSRFRTWPGYARTVEHSVYVETSFRGRGVGARLLDALVEHATALGHHAMIAGIVADNAASIALHRRAGFQEVGRLPEVGRKFDRWLDLIFMQRLLPTSDELSPSCDPAPLHDTLPEPR